MTNATCFGDNAATYVKGRPGYPPELFDWISEKSPGRELVWDVGAGSGQATLALPEHFARVHATDISAEQIASAPAHPQIQYHAAPAHMSGLPVNSVDSVTVATAVHWFATEDFWNEVERVAKADGFFCAWAYQLPRTADDVQIAFLDPIYDLIDPYWAEGNRICMKGYSADRLSCPFPTVSAPVFDAGGLWSVEKLVNFAQSWSAYFRASEDGQSDHLERLCQMCLDRFGGVDIPMNMPLTILAARIGG